MSKMLEKSFDMKKSVYLWCVATSVSFIGGYLKFSLTCFIFMLVSIIMCYRAYDLYDRGAFPNILDKVLMFVVGFIPVMIIVWLLNVTLGNLFRLLAGVIRNGKI